MDRAKGSSKEKGRRKTREGMWGETAKINGLLKGSMET